MHRQSEVPVAEALAALIDLAQGPLREELHRIGLRSAVERLQARLAQKRANRVCWWCWPDRAPEPIDAQPGWLPAWPALE